MKTTGNLQMREQEASPNWWQSQKWFLEGLECPSELIQTQAFAPPH